MRGGAVNEDKKPILFCPFCAEGAIFIHASPYPRTKPVAIACTGELCGVHTPWCVSATIAATIWNRRVARKPGLRRVK